MIISASNVIVFKNRIDKYIVKASYTFKGKLHL